MAWLWSSRQAVGCEGLEKEGGGARCTRASSPFSASSPPCRAMLAVAANDFFALVDKLFNRRRLDRHELARCGQAYPRSRPVIRNDRNMAKDQRCGSGLKRQAQVPRVVFRTLLCATSSAYVVVPREPQVARSRRKLPYVPHPTSDRAAEHGRAVLMRSHLPVAARTKLHNYQLLPLRAGREPERGGQPARTEAAVPSTSSSPRAAIEARHGSDIS